MASVQGIFYIFTAKIWQWVFVILLIACKVFVMKAEHTIASYDSRDFTSKMFNCECKYELINTKLMAL
jgi:hypothetical protein